MGEQPEQEKTVDAIVSTEQDQSWETTSDGAQHVTKTVDHLSPAAPPDYELYLHLIRRYRRAIAFFQDKMDNVDLVLSKARAKAIADSQLLALMERKYPFMKDDRTQESGRNG